MTIVRCSKCKIVVLDSNEDGERKVKCMECGRWYRIRMEKGEMICKENLGLLSEAGKEVTNA